MDAFTGEIRLFAFDFAPTSWAFCDGSLLPISQNATLFSIVGKTYGGDGRTNFALPDLRGRAVAGTGSLGGQSLSSGDTMGDPSVVLGESSLPSHSHIAVGYQAQSQGTPGPVANAYVSLPRTGATVYDAWTPPSDSATRTSLAPLTLGLTGGTPTGGVDAHDNVSPFLGMNFCICLNGDFYPTYG